MDNEVEIYLKKFFEEEKKFLKPLEDPWFYINDDGEFETINPDIIIIEFADEESEIYRGLSLVPDNYVLFFNSGEINKSCEISREKAIEYMILCDKDLIIEFNLENDVFELFRGNEVINMIYNIKII